MTGAVEGPRISTGRLMSGRTAWAAATQTAIDFAAVRAHGLALGLTASQIDDTIVAYVAHYRSRPEPLDLDLVREALTLRSMRVAWEPDR